VNHRAEPIDPGVGFALTVGVLEDLLERTHCSVPSWHAMCVTEPPLSHIGLQIFCIRCDGPSSSRDRDYRALKEIRNPKGVTIKEIFDALWDTTLPRNMGLVEDVDKCVFPPLDDDDDYDDNSDRECICYGIL
jgi:hypothetical protein